MSVESFYFCANLEKTNVWWTQPLDRTISDIKDFQPHDRADHPWLTDIEEVITDILPKIVALKADYPSQSSLSEICGFEVEHFLQVSEKRSTRLLPALWRKSKGWEKAYKDLEYTTYFYLSLGEATWQGPTNRPMNKRLVEDRFFEFLGRYMSDEEARSYHGSFHKNLIGPCPPPELDRLPEKIQNRLQISMQPASKVDAATWHPRWVKLGTIQGLWHELEIDTNPAVVAYLKAIEEIAGYALENNLTMLKLYM